MLNKLIDDYGNVHTPITSNQTIRIVSLVPSITELLCDLGLKEYIVGRTGFCIHPASLQSTPKVGGTKDVNIEKIRRLNASHLIVNIDENEKDTVAVLSKFIPNVIVTHPISPRDNLKLYHLLGNIFQVENQAKFLSQEFESAYQQLIGNKFEEKNEKKVLYCIWKDPWMSVSKETYIAQMLALKNWHNIELSSKIRYPSFDWNETSLTSLDAILLSTEPYRFTIEHVTQLQQTLNKPVVLVDGEMLSWYGSRAIQGLRYLHQLNLP